MRLEKSQLSGKLNISIRKPRKYTHLISMYITTSSNISILHDVFHYSYFHSSLLMSHIFIETFIHTLLRYICYSSKSITIKLKNIALYQLAFFLWFLFDNPSEEDTFFLPGCVLRYSLFFLYKYMCITCIENSNI